MKTSSALVVCFVLCSIEACSSVDCPTGSMSVMGHCTPIEQPGAATMPNPLVTSGTAGTPAVSGSVAAVGGAGGAGGAPGMSGPIAGSGIGVANPMGAPGSGSAGASAAGGAGAGVASGGAAGASAGPPPCAQPNAIRCSEIPGGRELCTNGVWAPISSCAPGDICAGPESAKPGECLSLAAVCRGKEGQATCDGSGMLYVCDANGTIASQDRCGKAELCMAGLPMGQCAKCVPGTFDCQGTALLECVQPAMGYTMADTCAAASLCDKAGGACTAAACEPGEFKCMGDQLQQCSPDRTRFDTVRPCGPGLCNSERGECNECVPNTRPACEGNALVSCGPDGTEIREVCDEVCNINRCAECKDFDSEDCAPPGSPECGGRRTCLLGFWGSCERIAKPGVRETCDGEDNDCDGTPDNCPAGWSCRGNSTDCLPSGSYLNSCSDCTVSGSASNPVLSCSCGCGGSTCTRRDTIHPESCSEDICQYAGCLVCGCSSVPEGLDANTACPSD